MKQKLHSRFAAVRIQCANRNYWYSEPHAEELAFNRIAQGGSRIGQSRLSNLPAKPYSPSWRTSPNTARSSSVIIEELKQKLGPGHFDGRRLHYLTSTG